MKIMNVLSRIKNGERVIVTLTKRDGEGRKYNLSDGTDVSAKQFAQIQEFLMPLDVGLLPDAEPQSYQWHQ